jgi:hypothetical protein
MIERGPDGEVVAAAVTVSEPATETSTGTGLDGFGAAAFFDVDNTVLQGASVFHLGRGLW